MKADAIIFDKDGTLIDFDAFWVPLTVKAVEAVLIKTNMKSAPMDRILEAFGISDGITSIEGVLCKGTYRQMGEIMHAILSEYGYNGSADELTALLINAYNESTDAGEIKPTCTELAEALTELKKQNKRLAVVTTDNREITEKCLKALGIAELFDRIYTDGQGIPTKPDPYCVFDFCSSCGVERERVVMVGDTMTDVKFAKNAGIFVIGVAKAESNKAILLGEADTVISKISELCELIE